MNGRTVALINITNKILKGILVAVFSRCIRGTSHSLQCACILETPFIYMFI